MPRHAQARILDRAIPEDLVERIAKPIIHRPQMVPADTSSAGLQFPFTSPGAAPEAPLQDMGVNPPKRVKKELPMPLVDEPTRVDVANRYLGNKACCYETAGPKPRRLRSPRGCLMRKVGGYAEAP